MGIPTVTLSNGTLIPQLGLGTWQLPGERVATPLSIALELGYTHIDTAEIYNNHATIGRAIRNVPRSKLFITSKIWHTQLGYEDVLASCDRALRDLGTSYLDLYLVHWPNNDIPMVETFRALEELNAQGKVRAIGVSNFTVRLLQEAISASKIPITMNQVEIHPWLYQKDLLGFCRRSRIAVTAYSPLSHGMFLTDPILRGIAKRHGRTPAQICLRWGVQHELIVIPKASSRAHIEENRQIFDFSLTAEDMKELDSMPQRRLIQPEYAEF